MQVGKRGASKGKTNQDSELQLSRQLPLDTDSSTYISM